MRVAVAQINTTVGAIEANAALVRQWLADARPYQPDLVVFPEMTLTGYPPEDLLFKHKFVESNIKALHSLAPLSRQAAFIVGYVDRSHSGRLHNSAAYCAKGRIQAVYHKKELPNYGVFDEKRYFEPGQNTVIVRDVRGNKIGLSICEDMWEKKSFLYSAAFSKDLSVIVNISASPYHAGKHEERKSLVRGLTRKSGCPVIYANLIGGQDELVFDGGSMIMSGDSRLLAEGPLFKEGFLWADISEHGRSLRAPKKPPLPSPPNVSLRSSLEKEVYDALVLGTRDYIVKNGFKKALIGLSGGIDSALVASIACDALGPDRVVGVTMPSRYSSRDTLKDSHLLARNLGMECLELGIEPLFKSYLSILKKCFKGLRPDSTEENIQARIRGNLLMALSNKWGYLVLTTGNKSEMATGYCTLYGDMAGGFAVIKDVPKTLVFRLAAYRNSITGHPRIPGSIIRRAPSAELRAGQKDQDTLPPYSVLDKILKEYVESDLSSSQILVRNAGKSLVKKVLRMVDKSEYKRRQAPPGIKITPKAFGRDRRIPITNRFPS